MTNHQKLIKLVFQGLQQKFENITDVLLDRINYELSHLKDERVCQYLLAYKRIIDACNRLNIVRSPGRGASACSLVNYCLDITTINPLAYGLHFEKLWAINEFEYLNIQTDIPAASRELILKEIQKEFQDSIVATVLIPLREDEKSTTIQFSIQSVTYRLHVCAIAIVTKDDKRLIEMHGEHFMPFQNYLNEAKENWHYFFDLLSLTYLDPIQELVNRKGSHYHPRNYPLNDNATINLFAKAKTKGIYQFETDSMKKWLKRMQPESLNDIILLNALFRPHSLKFIDEIVRAKLSWNYKDRNTDPIRRTALQSYGILFYQESFVEVMVQLAGISQKSAWKYIYTLAISKDEEENLNFINKFVDGCVEQNTISKMHAENLATYITNNINNSFGKSHSSCYGIMAYWMGYFNEHYKKLNY